MFHPVETKGNIDRGGMFYQKPDVFAKVVSVEKCMCGFIFVCIDLIGQSDKIQKLSYVCHYFTTTQNHGPSFIFINGHLY